jgi:diguanylate cyclase (GGDEF)-like protein
MILDFMSRNGDTEDRLLRIIQTQNEIATSDLEPGTAMRLAADRALRLTDARTATIESLDGSRRFVTGDAAAHPPVTRAVCRGPGGGSLIRVPLRHRAEAVGVLTVAHPEPDHFSAGDTQALELLSDLIAAHLSHAELLAEEAHDSRHDALTGLPNRRAYEERLRHELARARRHRRPLALCLLDLDGFKGVNDALGHPAGDRILRAVADAIRSTRAADEGFRIGGDEFAVLLPETTARDAVPGVRRVVDALARTEVEGLAGIGVSYGIASGERDADALHLAADRELLAAKSALYGRHGNRRDAMAA